MSISHFPAAERRHLPGILLTLVALSVSVCAYADNATPEHAHLVLALRQLDAIDRLVAQETARPRPERSRYYFDYARLAADLDRVRTGIRDYLTPTRAQPRDPVELLGDYRQPTAPARPEPGTTP